MACINWGRIAVAISWQKSPRKLVNPIAKTFRFSQEKREDVCSDEVRTFIITAFLFNNPTFTIGLS